MAWWKRSNKTVGEVETSRVRQVAGFYPELAALQTAFSRHAERLGDPQSTVPPLVYSFTPDGPRSLIASPVGGFWDPPVLAFMDHLQAWAGDHLSSLHISTPNLTVFLEGMGRLPSRDLVKGRWHYLYCCSPNPDTVAVVSVNRAAAESDPKHNAFIDLELVDQVRIGPGDLLVHGAQSEYAIDPLKTSMNPANALVFLNGYLW